MRHLRSCVVLPAAIVVLALASCRKERDCPMNYVSVPLGVGFSGYSAAQLRLILLDSRPEEDSAGSFLTDTLSGPRFVDSAADTLVLAQQLLRRNRAYRIRIPATGDSYQLGRQHFAVPDVDAPYKPSECLVATFYASPDSVEVEGRPVATSGQGHQTIIVLARP